MNYDDVPGWFQPVDQAAFAWILECQNRTEPPGALVELGVFKGKSAIHIANFLRETEVLTVCDLFEDVATSDQVDRHERDFLATQGLSQRGFEHTFLAFQPRLPRVVRAPSGQITRHVAPDTARFVHVDAGHAFARVQEDLVSARAMLRDSGVVAVNDYRKAETLGVAAAVWEAVIAGSLRPFLTTPNKIYATWGDPAPLRAEVVRRASGVDWCALRRDVMIHDLPVHHLQRKT